MATLYVVSCGGYPGRQVPEFSRRMMGQGWQVCVIGTPSGIGFLDVPEIEELTGFPVRSQYKRPGTPDVLPAADAIVVAPATFNTINKWAGGISDTLALGLVNEAMGKGLPIVAAPWPNQALAKHPAFTRSVELLSSAGVRFVLDPSRLPDNTPDNHGNSVFPWDEVDAAVLEHCGAPA